MALREPKEITITDGDGKDHKFTISKMSAWDGLEIMSRFPSALLTAGIPKIADWQAVDDLKLKIMKYVTIKLGDLDQALVTQAFIDSHCRDWEVFVKLIIAEVEYNNSFFRKGTIWTFLEDIGRQYRAKITEILTHSSAQSSPQEKQPSMSSETQASTQ